jgi:methyl-accepting chemotaxis protein
MDKANWIERILSYFTTINLATEEVARRNTTVRRLAAAQVIGAVILIITQLITNTLGTPGAIAAIAVTLTSALFVLWLTTRRRPIEGAWVLVLTVTVAITILAVQEVRIDGAEVKPVLSGIIYIWPVLVAGAALAINVVIFVALGEALLFLLTGFPPTHWQTPYLVQYAFSIVAILAFVAYVIRHSARSLQEALVESELRAAEIMKNNETLMEKNIQQVTLAAQLSLSATDLSATARQQASGSTEQASAISEVTSTIEEMGYTARQIAQSSENVAQLAEQTLEAVGQGQSAVDESVAAMEGIKGRVQELADKVLALGEHSQRIGEIMQIINNIADETHLLALNAAIESAGAGEHGRRFAVVAAEVKNLANRAIESSKEVSGIIAEIQRATNASVMAAEQGLKETERGGEQVYQAGRAMEEIVLLAQRTSQASQEISLATTQQRTASEQIVETMREIAEVANQTAEGSRQVAEAAATLSGIGEQLQSAGRSD